MNDLPCDSLFLKKLILRPENEKFKKQIPVICMYLTIKIIQISQFIYNESFIKEIFFTLMAEAATGGVL